jgi:hypothetical protein
MPRECCLSTHTRTRTHTAAAATAKRRPARAVHDVASVTVEVCSFHYMTLLYACRRQYFKMLRVQRRPPNIYRTPLRPHCNDCVRVRVWRAHHRMGLLLQDVIAAQLQLRPLIFRGAMNQAQRDATLNTFRTDPTKQVSAFCNTC